MNHNVVHNLPRPPLNCPKCADQCELLEQLGSEIDANTADVLWRCHEDCHPGSGPYTPTEPGWAGRTSQADAMAIADFTIGKREELCTTCWLIHRPGACDA